MKKILSVVISFALLLLACPIISVASNDGVLTRRALVMSAVYDYTAVCRGHRIPGRAAYTKG